MPLDPFMSCHRVNIVAQMLTKIPHILTENGSNPVSCKWLSMLFSLFKHAFQYFILDFYPNINLTRKVFEDSCQVDRCTHSDAIFGQSPLDVAQHAPHRENHPSLGGPGCLCCLLLSSSTGHDETVTRVRFYRDTSDTRHYHLKISHFLP